MEAGGWGLWLRTEDLAKIMLCYQQGGVFQGEQVIPAFWAKAAPQKQTDNSSSKGADTSAGYGFGLWRCKGEAHAYRADGLFSQFGIVFEDYDAVLVMTNAALDEQSVLDCIWRHFPKAFQEKPWRNRLLFHLNCWRRPIHWMWCRSASVAVWRKGWSKA